MVLLRVRHLDHHGGRSDPAGVGVVELLDPALLSSVIAESLY